MNNIAREITAQEMDRLSKNNREVLLGSKINRASRHIRSEAQAGRRFVEYIFKE